MNNSIIETIHSIEILGYEARYDYINSNNTTYLDILDKGEIIFKIRLSDHNLRPGNYLPAGVINESKYSINTPIPIEFLRLEISTYFNMSAEEKEYLWTNRLLIRDPNYPSLTILEEA